MRDLPILVEYQTTRLDLSGRVASALAATKAVSVAPDPEPGWWQVTAGQYVGTVIVEDVRLLIRPKIRPENLFSLLEVGLPENAWRQEAFNYASSRDLLPSVIAFFARTVETTLARGALRSYREESESLVALRGRVDVAAQIKRGGAPFPISCRYEDYTPDNAENRYVKAAVRRASQVPMVQAVDRRRLLQQLASLEDVADVPATPDDLGRIPITRLNAHYEPALGLARLILQNLTVRDQHGATSASSFLVDMNNLFERFVTERLRRALAGRLEVRGQGIVSLGEHGYVRMQPDLEFRRRGITKFVGDIKYKLTSDAVGRHPDYYQLLAYTTALDLPEGVLIYCRADGGAPERSVTVRHAGKVLHTRAVDLSGGPTSVAREIDELADWIIARAGSMRPRSDPTRQ